MRNVALALLIACGPAATDLPAEAAPAAPTPAADAPMATWEGGTITAAELDEEVRSELVKLETEYLTGGYQARSRALEGLAVEKMLAAAAEAKGVPVEELLRVEVEEKITAPTLDEMHELYPAMARRMGEVPFETAQPYLEQELIYRKQVERYGVYIDELKTSVGFKIELPYPDLPRVDIAFSDSDPFRGDVDAPVTIVQFAEYACHYCGVVEPTLDELMKRYEGKIKIVFKDYPLREQGPSIPAAISAHCAGEQGKYWEMNHLMLTNQGALNDSSYRGWAGELDLDTEAFGACLSSGKFEPVVQASAELGRSLGVNSTPTFFVNGLLLSGAQPVEQFAMIIDKELAK